MSERSNSTVKSKVKEHLRQSLEDKCSKIGGWQIFFGLNDSMLRMLTPVEEVVTPVPGKHNPSVTPELLYPENTITQLSNSEYCHESLSCHITDINTLNSRCVLGLDVGSHIDFNDTRNNGAATQPKSVSTTKSKRRKKKHGPSTGRGSDSADIVVSDRNKESYRLSGGRDDKQDKKLDKKADRKNKKQLVSVQRSMRNGHKITEIELPTIGLPFNKKGSNDQTQKGNCSRSRVNYTNISVNFTLPPLEECSPNTAKKDSKAKSNGTNKIHVSSSIQQPQRALKGQTRTSVVTLPPIKSISGRDNHVQSDCAPETQLMSEQLLDKREGRISKTKQKRIGTVPDNIRLPSINTNKLPCTDRANPKKERICPLQVQKP